MGVWDVLGVGVVGGGVGCMGVDGGCSAPHTHAHECAWMHAHACMVNMIISCKPLTLSPPPPHPPTPQGGPPESVKIQ